MSNKPENNKVVSTNSKSKEAIRYPKINNIYRHYKGGTYKVICIAPHTETKEVLVVYKSLVFGSFHARPLQQWFEEVIVNDKDNNEIIVLRFEWMSEPTKKHNGKR